MNHDLWGIKHQVKPHTWVFNKLQRKLFEIVQLHEKLLSSPTPSEYLLEIKDVNLVKRRSKSLEVSVLYLSLFSTLDPGGMRRTSKRFSSSFQNRRSISDTAVSTGAREFVFNSGRVIKFLVTNRVHYSKICDRLLVPKDSPILVILLTLLFNRKIHFSWEWWPGSYHSNSTENTEEFSLKYRWPKT